MATGQFHEVFAPVRKNKVPVFSNQAAVAAVKPPVFKHRRRPFRVLVIPDKNARLTVFDFTGCADVYLRPLMRRPDRLKMDLIISGTAERPPFGCSIQAFKGNIEGVVEPEGIRAEYRSGRITDSGV